LNWKQLKESQTISPPSRSLPRAQWVASSKLAAPTKGIDRMGAFHQIGENPVWMIL
jgi:hypothetical protein